MELSIITINYNNGNGLEKTIQSVRGQSFQNFEHIIIDGGSTDNSVEVINKFVDKLANWVSEKDGGIYPAMNKGIKKASGKYIQFLNAGDVYYDNDSLLDFFGQAVTADIVYADFATLDKSHIYKMPDEITFRYFYKGCIQHQASLIKKDVFEKFGYYDEGVPIIADWDHFIRMIFLHNVSTQHVSLPFICFDFSDSMSNDPNNRDLIYKTREMILQKYFSGICRDMKYLETLESSNSYKLIRKITKIRSIFKI